MVVTGNHQIHVGSEDNKNIKKLGVFMRSKNKVYLVKNREVNVQEMAINFFF